MKRRKKVNAEKVLFCLVLLILVGVIVYIALNNNKPQEEIVEEQTASTKPNLEDKEAPEITLNGNSNIVIALGNSYTDSGAKAIDNIDGDISSKIEIQGEVDTKTEGEYTVKYVVTDSSQNLAQVERTVIVRKPLQNGLPVLMYHFFYDANERDGQDNNWLEISKFEEQMKYLQEENFYFPTWQEVEAYIDGKIDLPSKSVVLTVDDGDPSFFKLAVPILQKYNATATSFVITSWYGYVANDKQANVYYESHSDCMHEAGTNGKGVMLSWSQEKIENDLETSSKTLGGATIFCYPLGQYNQTGINALKNTGYKLAFTTKGGRVYEGTSKYELPRVRISKTTTLREFKNMVN